jgi:CDP-diacylglycerol--glycerol-3-phosphate 3-phosphatidyltransferase
VDVACSLSIVALIALIVLAYAVRLAVEGRARFARVDREGKSALLGKGAMEMLYWSAQPIGDACVRFGIGANAVTWGSLAIAAAAGIAIAMGHLGLGALLSVVAAAADAIDGLVARKTGTASDAGEVLDASVDRYVELFFLGGAAIYFRGDVALLVLTLAALGASFMVSYSTAKAEALHVEAPRGSMRRTERAVCFVVGAALTPVAGVLGVAMPWSDAPLVAALAIVAVLGNISAAVRLGAVIRAVRLRDGSRAVSVGVVNRAVSADVVNRAVSADVVNRAVSAGVVNRAVSAGDARPADLARARTEVALDVAAHHEPLEEPLDEPVAMAAVEHATPAGR